MRNLGLTLGIVTPVLAISFPGAAGASGGDSAPQSRAIALQVQEDENSVEVEIVARSGIAQTVDYTIELVGSSRSRHRASTSVPANEDRVLSRLKTGYTENWCATLDVTEGDGTSYTLTAGDCSAQT